MHVLITASGVAICQRVNALHSKDLSTGIDIIYVPLTSRCWRLSKNGKREKTNHLDAISVLDWWALFSPARLPRVPVLCFSRNLTSSKQYCVNETARQFSDTCPVVVATEIKLWCDCSMTIAQACTTWLQISNFVSVRDWFAALLSQRKPGWRGQATWRSLCTHMYGRCKFTYSYNLLKVPPFFPKAYCFHGLFLQKSDCSNFPNDVRLVLITT